MIPTIYLSNGKVVQPQIVGNSLVAGEPIDVDVSQVYRQFRYAVEICVYDLDETPAPNSPTQELIKKFVKEGWTRIGFPNSSDVEVMYQHLDSGATSVIVPLTQGAVLSELPKDRFYIAVHANDLPSTVDYAFVESLLGTPETIQPVLKSSAGIVLHIQESASASTEGHVFDEASVKAFKAILVERFSFGTRQLVLAKEALTLEVLAQWQHAGAEVSVGGSLISRGGEAALIHVADALTSQLNTDRVDGLFTTLVVDEQGIALGVVYSSRESIRKSVEVGRGVYQSRKRGLWFKGETSGAIQELVHIDHDCDADCLRFVVKQIGVGFCHLNRRTCYGGDNGIPGLMRTLLDRRVNAPAGSYTKRLFDDSALLKAKLHEEADELLEAQETNHVAAEAADVIYFALVAAARAGVELADIERHLDRRSLRVRRRAGNAKPAYLPTAAPPPSSSS